MLSFGLVTIPVKLYSAVQPNELSFHLLHKADVSPIRFAKVCKQEGKEVPYEDIVKGYEIEDGEYVIMADDDFKKAHRRETSTIEIIQFARESEIDPIYCDKPYYLEPDKKAQKPYSLLIEALRQSKKVGIAKYVLRNKEHLAAIRPEGSIMLLEQLRFHEEIRSPAGLATLKKIELNKKEIVLALQLIEQLSSPFKASDFKDSYTDALREIIEAKAAGLIPKAKGTAPEPIRVRDLMQVLQKSLNKEKKKHKPAVTAVQMRKIKQEP